ncbi:hypothetical protein IV417_08805 [Alphaproteobacteria bacterium KMM 3653]|uniref:Type II secretory pathway, component PulF n=1 Tax=Harenicola maris TaxID=2841044 RepID=A0AAP2CPT3_9RHOB|nr:hypothetical protein [Harenicola maris]
MGEKPKPNAKPKTKTAGAEKPKKVSRQVVYTLVIEVGRKEGDGLPEGSTGGGMVCYATGVDEAEAVREAVNVLKQADLAPLDVTSYGTLEERLAEGEDIPDEEKDLMNRALEENSVVIAQFDPIY